jgi:hypothetical protein
VPETPETLPGASRPTRSAGLVRLVGSWLWVGVPLAWGVWQTVLKSLDLFK